MNDKAALPIQASWARASSFDEGREPPDPFKVGRRFVRVCSFFSFIQYVYFDHAEVSALARIGGVALFLIAVNVMFGRFQRALLIGSGRGASAMLLALTLLFGVGYAIVMSLN